MPHPLLIVEDDSDSAYLYELFLEGLPVEISCAESIPDAIEALAGGLRPEIVVLDYHVGSGDVHGFASQLRDLAGPRSTRILLVSGEDGLAAKAESLRADAFLRKPVDLGDFQTVILQLLGEPVTQNAMPGSAAPGTSSSLSFAAVREL